MRRFNKPLMMALLSQNMVQIFRIGVVARESVINVDCDFAVRSLCFLVASASVPLVGKLGEKAGLVKHVQLLLQVALRMTVLPLFSNNLYDTAINHCNGMMTAHVPC